MKIFCFSGDFFIVMSDMIKRTPVKPKVIQKLCCNRVGNVTFLFVSSLTGREMYSNVIYTQVWVSLSKLFKCLH